MNMDRQAIRSAGSTFAVIVLLVCTGFAQAQQPPQGGRGRGGGPPAGAGAPRVGGGLPTENTDDAEEIRARLGGTFAMRMPSLPANAPQPSTDPRNFEGTWFHEDSLVTYIARDMFGVPVSFTPEGRKVTQRRVDSIEKGTPYLNASAYCIPVGQFWQFDLNMPFQIFQAKDRMELQFEEFHGLITISLDPAKAPPAAYMGSSVAHWDGNTLVVETSGFKEGLWVTTRGTSMSRNAKLTQRIRKVKSGDKWYLEMVYTIDDPTYYTQPWSFARRYAWHPDMTLLKEYNCEQSTGAKGGVDPSLVPEPTD
jgi:hypothetical protein